MTWKCIWIYDVDINCVGGLLGEFFVVGWRKPGISLKTRAGIEPETSHMIAGDFVYCAIVTSFKLYVTNDLQL